MKRFILAIVLVLAFCADSFALNLRPYMQTPPEVQVFAKRVIEDGGIVVDLEYCQKYTRLSKQLIIWSNGKFVGDANMGVKLNSGVSVQTLYDLSGNNNDATQATVGNQPVWTAGVQGGRAGMVFDGTDDVLRTDSPVLSATNITVMAIASLVSFTGNYKARLMSQITNVGAWILTLGFATAAQTRDPFALVESGSVGAFSKSPIEYAFNTTLLLDMTHDGTNLTLYINGSEKDQDAAIGTMDASALVMSIGDIDLGWGTRNYSNIKYEFGACFSTALTTAQRTATEAFLNAYYSIY